MIRVRSPWPMADRQSHGSKGSLGLPQASPTVPDSVCVIFRKPMAEVIAKKSCIYSRLAQSLIKRLGYPFLAAHVRAGSAHARLPQAFS